jgi:predicted LPLAT superfamily acyltransferase
VDTGNRDADLEASLAQAAAFLEATLKTFHEQWLNFFEFWPADSND